MAIFVEKIGKTVEEAVESALKELNTSIENVTVEVLEEGAKGVLGLFGSKEAKVRVSMVEDVKIQAGTFVSNILEKMDIDATISVDENEDHLKIDIFGDDIGILIGRRGETLDAIQYLTGLAVNKDREEYIRVVVDIENYRKKREDTLTKLAFRMADKVEKYKKSIALEPMSPYERRVIHAALQGRFNIETSSIGDEPNRKVIIKIKNQKR